MKRHRIVIAFLRHLTYNHYYHLRRCRKPDWLACYRRQLLQPLRDCCCCCCWWWWWWWWCPKHHRCYSG